MKPLAERGNLSTDQVIARMRQKLSKLDGRSVFLTGAQDVRVGADGAIVPLEEQDRTRWNRDAIAEGLHALDKALAQRRRGPYQVQAAIAALHSRALRAEDTDWKQIAALYGGLLREQPGAVVESSRQEQ